MKQLDFTGGMPESETKTLVVFVDCHTSHNVEIRVNEYYERMFRSFCKRQGYKCCIRSKRTEARIARMTEEQQRTEAASSQPQRRKASSLRMISRVQRDICETDAHQPLNVNLYHVGFDQATQRMFLASYKALQDHAVIDFESTEDKPMYVAEGVRHGKSTIVVYRPCASDNEMKFVYYQKGGEK